MSYTPPGGGASGWRDAPIKGGFYHSGDTVDAVNPAVNISGKGVLTYLGWDNYQLQQAYYNGYFSMKVEIDGNEVGDNIYARMFKAIVGSCGGTSDQTSNYGSAAQTGLLPELPFNTSLKIWLKGKSSGLSEQYIASGVLL